ncbi:helix-turn-helix transcriptional regulator [Algoriphagus sp.]|uniref:helix-turn-helix domain-containing protein n=1 Tax=Algoriphagus sp. TaxID=1872435 RepID=UPI0026081AD7|nr:helix-turn-helix transcriptional regulator [Algoriphagus sp.]
MENRQPIRVKNMVCPRCIQAVKEVLNRCNIPFQSVDLGSIQLHEPLSSDKKKQLAKSLQELGFDILESKNSSIIESIKNTLIHQIHHSGQVLETNYSDFLEAKLQQDYHQLSRLFSQVEGVTIEKYITRLKIEKAKELILYNERKLAEIAFQLGYNSAAYLSALFKKETGMTPSLFKQNAGKRKNLDEV